jgi:hypothetical protein
VVAVCPASVVDDQLLEHVAVVRDVEDAFEDDVVPGIEGVGPTFTAPGRSRSRSTIRRRLSCPTRARPRPKRLRISAATVLFPLAEFPRTQTSRVSVVPTIMRITLSITTARTAKCSGTSTQCAGTGEGPCPSAIAWERHLKQLSRQAEDGNRARSILGIKAGSELA